MILPEFVTQDPDGHLRLTGHRIGLQDIVFHYREGYSAEMLLAEFPTLSLSLIHKALGFYLEHRAEIDACVSRCVEEVEQQRASAHTGPSREELRRRLEAMTAPAGR